MHKLILFLVIFHYEKFIVIFIFRIALNILYCRENFLKSWEKCWKICPLSKIIGVFWAFLIKVMGVFVISLSRFPANSIHLSRSKNPNFLLPSFKLFAQSPSSPWKQRSRRSSRGTGSRSSPKMRSFTNVRPFLTSTFFTLDFFVSLEKPR